MKSTTIEEFLGSLYTDAEAQIRFRMNPVREAQLAGLSEEDCGALAKIDWAGFELACGGFERKRNAKASRRASSTLRAVFHKLRRLFERA